MSAAESVKFHLNNLLGSIKPLTVLRFTVTLLLLFVTTRTGADLTWQLSAHFLNKDRATAPGQPPRQAAPASGRALPAPAAPAEEIALFGQTGAGSAPPAGQTGIAPVSAVNLVLKGVVAVRPMRRALAIIAERGAAEKLYGQGETLPGNAVIQEIHPDRVIISRGGVLETLPLDNLQKTATGEGASPAASRSASAGEAIQSRGDGTNWRINRDYWDERLADVPGLAREVGVEIYLENNQQKGYRLLSVQNGKLLNDLGLQPGDILLSVNGRPMGNIQAGLAAYQQMKDSKQVSIEISRNGRRESRIYSIGG